MPELRYDPTVFRRQPFVRPAMQDGARAVHVAARAGRARGGQSDPAQIQDLSATPPVPVPATARVPRYVRWKPRDGGRVR